MKSLFERWKSLALGSLLAIPLAMAVGCGSSNSSPDAGGGGGKAGNSGAGGGVGGGTALGGAGGGTPGTGGVGGGTPGLGGAGGGGTAGAGGNAGPIEFTDFVNDLIKNKTSSTTTPETINDKTFKDSMNPAAFNSLFP